LSEVRRESGGEIRPDTGCEFADQLLLEYGGGGPLPYSEVGLTTAVAAMVEGLVYDGRSVLMCSSLSRLIMNNPLCLLLPPSASIARSEAKFLQIRCSGSMRGGGLLDIACSDACVAVTPLHQRICRLPSARVWILCQVWLRLECEAVDYEL
jgi:hypothetical protein